MDDSLRACWEVTAGIVPGVPMDYHTKRFPLFSAQWDDGSEEGAHAFQRAQGEALVYALSLQHPANLNWVRLEWIWL